ncbi:MAG: prolyl oligopeptidase family serine peptidase, partial [Actinobacteria bacterium]|nr:prolyl oligopeptidase family serine peptidase [Actinomycetota bacterium]
ALEPPAGDLVDLRWAPDGHRLVAITSVSPPEKGHDLPYPVRSSTGWVTGPHHAAWIMETGRQPVRVGERLDNITITDWSPDADRLAVVSDQGVDRDTSLGNGIWLLWASSGEASRLVEPNRPISALAWSPDGEFIAYLAAARDNANSAINELWVVELSSGEVSRVAPNFDRSLGKPVRGDDERAIGPPILVWDDDALGLLAVFAEGGHSRLGRFGVAGDVEIVGVGHDCVLEFDVGASGLAISWSDSETPGEVSWVDRAGGSTQVSGVGESLMSQVSIAPTERITVMASDGVEVEGWLTLPPEPAGAALVLQVHGGPHYAVGERFSFDAQRLAGRGFAVLRANPRGSQGYGQAFADGNLGDW